MIAFLGHRAAEYFDIFIIRFPSHLHMNTVRQDGQDGDGVDDDDPDDGVPGVGPGVHHGGVCHGLQSVQGNRGQAQGGDIDGDTLHQTRITW